MAPREIDYAVTEITTPRLRLVALTDAQLKLCAEAPDKLGNALGIVIAFDAVTEAVERAVRAKLVKMPFARETDHVWFTYWLVVVASQVCGVGFAGFKGMPDDEGFVEIGYGIAASFQGMGYATEAVGALIEWAFQAPNCVAVTAQTMKSNSASRRVLEKVGMRAYEETVDGISWRIEKR
jgi:[ribosomal protein S5]-alanine N-acetyltransferase